MAEAYQVLDEQLVDEITAEISAVTNTYVERGDELVDLAVVMALLRLALDGAREVLGRELRDKMIAAFITDEDMEELLAAAEVRRHCATN